MKACPDHELTRLIWERVNITEAIKSTNEDKKPNRYNKLERALRAIDKLIGARCQEIFTP